MKVSVKFVYRLVYQGTVEVEATDTTEAQRQVKKGLLENKWVAQPTLTPPSGAGVVNSSLQGPQPAVQILGQTLLS